jgi:hypothetical protein
MIPNPGSGFMEQAMGTVHKRRTPRAAVDDIRAMLSLREATGRR